MPKICSVRGCNNFVHAKGMCQPHYRRALKASKEGHFLCSIDSCNRPLLAKGLCSVHYDRMRHDGDPLRKGKIIREGLKRDNPLEYRSWIAMKNRCYDKNATGYANYGGRGIKVCDRWLGMYGFKHFLEDMGPRPSTKTKSGRYEYSIDRINVDGDYHPKNCRWATRVEQANNKRKKIL